MKKFIALLLVAIMAITAVIPAMAAENNETAPDAPVFYGAQTRVAENKGEGYSDVRFIATVSSDKGTCVGYEIVANYYEVGATEPAKTVTYTDTETESTTVYTSVLDNGETKTAGQLVDGAAYIFVVTLTDVPNAQNVDFTVTAYVKYNDTPISSTAKFQRYESGEIIEANNAYSRDFENENDNRIDFAANGITPLYNGKPYMYIKDSKLNVARLPWADCLFSLVNNSALETAVGSNSAYMVEMDLSFGYISVFGLIFNGECANSDTNPNDNKNSAIVQLRYASASGSNPASRDIAANDKIYLRAGKYDSTGKTVTITNPVNTTEKNDYLAYTVPSGKTTADFKLTVVLNHLDNGYTRIDLFINSVHKGSYTIEDANYWLKDKSFIKIWAQENDVTIDNLTVTGVTSQTDGTTIPTSIDTQNQYKKTFDTDTYVKDAVDSAIDIPAIKPLFVDNKALTMRQYGWNGGTCFDELVAGGNITAGQTYLFEVDADVTISGNLGFFFRPNEGVSSSATVMRKNAIRVNISVVSKKITLKVFHYDASGTEAGVTTTTISEQETSAFKGKIGVLVDSTFSGGTLVRVYIDNNCVETVFIKSATEAYDAVDNTSVALYWENAVGTLDDISIKTYTAPIAA